MRPSDVIAAYMNWVDRLIPQRSRETMVWDGFWSRNNPRRHAEAINTLIGLLRAGADMTPYLSRYVQTHGFEPARERRGIQWQNSGRGHKDFALNAYDLHHLHLKPSDSHGRHPGGSRELLYVGVSRKEVLLVMLGDHRSFDDGTLHEAVASWQADAGRDLKGVVGITSERTPQEAVRLLRNGVGGVTRAGPKFVPAGLISTAGTSIEHRRWADRISSVIEDYDARLDDPSFRSGWQADFGISAEATLSWGFWYGDFGVVDEADNSFYPLLPWRR
jgi:hypothetical protein